MKLHDLVGSNPLVGAGLSLATAAVALVLLVVLRRMLPREDRHHGGVLQVFLLLGGVLALFRLAVVVVGAGQAPFGRVVTMLATFFVAMGVVGTAVMGVFEILPTRARIRFPVLLRDLILVLTFVVVLFGALGHSGVDVASLVTTSAVLTAILGLALQSTLTNLLAGILLHVDRSLGLGDWVQFGDRVGQIIEIRWRSTVLRTSDNDRVIIPNAQITAQEVQNFSRPSTEHRAWLRVGLHYRHPPNEVRRVLVEAARSAPGVLKTHEPDCFPVEFGESAVVYALRYWIDDFEQAAIIEGEVRTRIWYGIQRAGLEIPYPIRTIVNGEGRNAPVDIPDFGARLAALEQVDLFAGLEPKERELLARGLRKKQFAAGEFIIRQGEPGDSMFVIASGRVRVALGQGTFEKTLAALGTGQFIGEMSLMTGDPRTASCAAVDDVVVYELDHVTFQNLLTTRPAIADRMSTLLAERQLHIERKGGELSALAAQQTAERKRKLLGRIRDFFDLH
jgi:small-conductance mechanosensitive channel/CRP-like cAMP-binding protein